MGSHNGGNAARTRREFLAALGAGSALLFVPLPELLAGSAEGRAQEGPLRVGHIAPDSGPLRSMGRAAVDGARLGAEDAGRAARLLDQEFALLEESAAGPGEAASAAESLAEQGASAIVGGFGDETCAALVEAAGDLGLAFLNVGSTADRFRGAACSPMAFHVQASDTMYLDAAVHWLVRRGRQGLVNFVGQRQEMWRWYFVHDATELGRRLHRRARDILSRVGGEALGSTEIDPAGGNAGAALREARAAGAWAVVGITQGEGLTGLVREHAALRADFDLVLPFGDRRRYTGDWAPEAFWPSLWHSSLFRYGATQLNNRFTDRFGRPMGPQAWANWAAVKLLGDLLVSGPATEGAGLTDRLEGEVAFDGYKGPPLSFRAWNHQMGQALYVLHPSVGDTVADPYQNIGRVPLSAADDQFVSQELVERLGIIGRSDEEAGCRLTPA